MSVRALRAAALVFALAGCGEGTTVPFVANCGHLAQAAPTSATIRVGENFLLAVTIEGGCPSPTVRNETPAVLTVDVAGSAFRVTGRAAGDGRVRVIASADTLVTTLVSVTVTP